MGAPTTPAPPPAPRGTIEGQIAAVLDNQRAVINRGAQDGVCHGMRFRVQSQQRLTIQDPASGAALGEVPDVAALVAIDMVAPRYAVGRVTITHRNYVGHYLRVGDMARWEHPGPPPPPPPGTRVSTSLYGKGNVLPPPPREWEWIGGPPHSDAHRPWWRRLIAALALVW